MSFKKLIVPAFAAFACIAISVGCKKSNNSTNSSSISATMGSTNISISSANTFSWYSTDSSVFEISGLSINGKDSAILGLQIFPPFKLDSAITDSWSVNIDYYIPSSQADYFAGNGFGHVSLTVTSQDTVNHKIAGTFSGTLYNGFGTTDSLVVTNGKFNTSYSVVP